MSENQVKQNHTHPEQQLQATKNQNIQNQISEQNKAQQSVCLPNQEPIKNSENNEQKIENETPEQNKVAQQPNQQSKISEINESNEMSIQQPQKQNGDKKIDHEKYQRQRDYLQDQQIYFSNRQLQRSMNQSYYNTFSVIKHEDQDRTRITKILDKIFVNKQKDQKWLDLKQLELSTQQNRGIACLLGLAICDALGASTQFTHFQKNRRCLIDYDFQDVRSQIKNKVLDARSGRIGIWTDDCSMALCLADSLILNNYTFMPKHARYMFHMWLEHGLNNGGRKYSIGLGGNIAISMRQFNFKREDFTEEAQKFNNGNGSLMRLAPVPICFYKDEKKAALESEKSSRTTHNGDEAKQCCKLLALIIVRLINRGEKEWKKVIEEACAEFVENYATVQSVKYLAKSEQEPKQLFDEQKQKYKTFSRFNKKPIDRNWNWKDQKFTYSPCRAKDQPGYVGSYCMDALSMALHTVWHNSSFKDIALMNCNMGGDCDTVGAIAGQISGAIYGIDEYMMHLYSQMEDVKENRYQVFLKAYKLMIQK